MRTVWRDFDKALDDCYVPRCSNCGTFSEPLHVHWFFTGLYCRNCVQYRLYDDCRTLEDFK